MRQLATIFALGALITLGACSDETERASLDCATLGLEGACVDQTNALQSNQIQTVGSHNSYKLAIPENELAVIAQTNEQMAAALDYAHIPLTEQLDLGMRQIELDVFYDPEGGRYTTPLLPKLAGNDVTHDTTVLSAPGYKVMHIQDVDFRTHCLTLVACLTEIKAWSEANPDHVPILIMMNAKDGKIGIPGTVDPLPFDAAAYDALDREVLAVFGLDRLITPDQIRGDKPTLREGALAGNWPPLAEARGKVIFALDEPPAKVTTYLRGKPSLEGLPFFVNSIGEEEDHAAYFTLNDPIAQSERIRQAVKSGFLVRTRADADTVEARTNDVRRREAAFASGAQYISTDYYQPRADFGDYAVTLPGKGPARCNPVLVGDTC